MADSAPNSVVIFAAEDFEQGRRGGAIFAHRFFCGFGDLPRAVYYFGAFYAAIFAKIADLALGNLPFLGNLLN